MISGEDHKEDHNSPGVQGVQGEEAACPEEVQALRAWREEGEEWWRLLGARRPLQRTRIVLALSSIVDLLVCDVES